MHRVLILGAGKIGALISGLLAESGSYKVYLGDVDGAAAESVVQAHALGASDVLINPVTKLQLLAKLIDHKPSDIAARENTSGGAEAAQGADALLEASAALRRELVLYERELRRTRARILKQQWTEAPDREGLIALRRDLTERTADTAPSPLLGT